MTSIGLAMSFGTHLAVLGLLILDLALGAPLAGHIAGRWAVAGTEFALILGYVLFVLQWLPWRRPDSGNDGQP
jgi:hypothetical protein